MTHINVSLSADDFAQLVTGQLVIYRRDPDVPELRIGLQDIGYDKIYEIVDKASMEYTKKIYEGNFNKEGEPDAKDS